MRHMSGKAKVSISSLHLASCKLHVLFVVVFLPTHRTVPSGSHKIILKFDSYSVKRF